MKIYLLILIQAAIVLAVSIPVKATILDKGGVTLEFQYKCDNMINAYGGIKQGYNYLGLANALLKLDSEAMKLWKGTLITLNVVNTHGKCPSILLIGDLQGLSNIANGNHTYIQEFYLSHTIKNTTILIGLQDLNKEFLNLQLCQNLINSSFGVPALISNNMPLAIFPLTTLGISTISDWSDHITSKIAIFDGAPLPFEENKYNHVWKLNKDDGIFGIAEANYYPKGKTNLFVIKVGAYYHTELWMENNETNQREKQFSHNYGFYLLSEYGVNTNRDKYKTALFCQYVRSPRAINDWHNYIGFGVVIESLFTKRDDAISLGLARISMNYPTKKNESAIELNYSLPFKKWVTISPGIQYILNPKAENQISQNAFVINLRLIVTL